MRKPAVVFGAKTRRLRTLYFTSALALAACGKAPEQQDAPLNRADEGTTSTSQGSLTDSVTSGPDTASTSSLGDKTQEAPSSGSTQTTTPSEIPTFPPEPTNLDYSVTLENPSTESLSNVPLTYGQVFLKGDVPATSSLQGRISGTPVALQVDVKSTHEDGSLRHAVISTVVPSIGPGETLVLETPAYSGEPTKAPSAKLSDLLATGLSTTLTLDVQERLDPAQPQAPGNTKTVRYEISLQELLTNENVQQWLSGPVVTEWMTSGPLKRTSDKQAHTNLHARFNVRYYPGTSKVRVDVSVENNWAFSEKPQNIYYDADLRINGNSMYSAQDVPHFKHSRWRKVYWSGEQAKINIRHRPESLIDSKAVPHYDPKLIGKLDPSILNYQKKVWVDAYADECAHYKGGAKTCTDPLAANVRRYRMNRIQPMGKGLVFYTGMASPGDTNMLGPLPTWSAAYILDQDPFTKNAMLVTGDLGGSWGIHYRDKNTGLPISMSDHPRATIDQRFASKNELLPRCTASFAEDSLECAVLYKPDTAHQPSFAYVPYLITGDHYYLEEMQFWATYNALANRPEYREFEKGLFANFEDRGQAWTLRKLARVAAFTPDAHPLKAYFTGMLDANLEHYTSVYLETPPNDYGSLKSRIYPRSSPWMDDFFTWAIQMTAELGFEKAQSLAKWKGNFPVMRMGKGSAQDNDYCYLFAAAYHMRIGAGSGLDDLESVGMFKTIKEVYEATNNKDIHPSENIEEIQFNDGGFECASQAMADHLGVPLNQLDGNSTASAGYVAILQMSLASAVDAGTPAALEAWNRYVGLNAHPEGDKNPKYIITPRKL